MLNGKLALMNGGTLEIDSPAPVQRDGERPHEEARCQSGQLEHDLRQRRFYSSLGCGQGIFFEP